MNLLNSKWIKFGSLHVEREDGCLVIENTGKKHAFLIYPHLFKSKSKKVWLAVEGELIKGNGCVLEILNRRRQILGRCGIGSFFCNTFDYLKYFILCFYVPAYSKVKISKVEYQEDFDLSLFNDHFTSDVLLITPGYPSLENKYNTAFVHTRIKAYQEAGIPVDVVVCNEIPDIKQYTFEGVHVFKCDYFYLRELLQKRPYKKILIHFFDDRYANILESVDTSETQLYFFLHGAETLYRDWPKIVSPYFGPEVVIDGALEDRFKRKDFFIKKYSHFKNAKWLFVTEWTRQRCEELLDFKFERSDVIPCLIDTELFSYERKDPELRKKIFVLRKFDDIRTYSLDTVVRVILELSRRPFFSDLEFDIYGDGSLHERILEPVKDFENVKIHKEFLTHEQIRKVHQTHGIALFPTRFDSQAVSSCEAASSGCAVVTSDIPGVRQFIPQDLGVLCDPEQYVQYADVIEKMYYDSEYFLKVAEAESQSVQSKFDYAHTIQKELDMYQSDGELEPFKGIKPAEPVLSVIIPSYNVEKYLKHTVFSLLDHRNASKVEILIVNDGSKDHTAEIAEELRKKYSFGDESVIRVINKENGGHGSTINVGIELARGKYIKVVDGDDTVDSEEFAKLIDILEHEDSDIVLNNYYEDFAKDNVLNLMKIYGHLREGIQYHFDDLCYDDYGFTSWGPILSCSSYRAEMLKKGNFKLSEKMFYVDMELNINVSILCDTITFYDLNIYRYLLGRADQSVNRNSYTRNYKHHENVCINMIETYRRHYDHLSAPKKRYIEEHLIRPMLSTQYEICINYHNKRGPFAGYDSRLKNYPEFYHNPKILISSVKFHRATKGFFIFMNPVLIFLNTLVHKVIGHFR